MGLSIVVAFCPVTHPQDCHYIQGKMFVMAQNFRDLGPLFIDSIDLGPMAKWPCTEEQKCSLCGLETRERPEPDLFLEAFSMV